MQYHALALAESEVTVDLVGEDGEALPARLQHPRIRVHRLPSRRGIGGVIGAAVALFRVCHRLPRPDVIVAQTPPAIPTIVVAWLLARLRGSRLVLDWHNLGWTILAARRHANQPLVHVARRLERMTAGLADAHLAVSDALAAHLRDSWRLAPVHVFRDRPDESFAHGIPHASMRARILSRAGLPTDARPAIALSPTSWTTDETLDMVLETADVLDARWHDSGPIDGLVIVISGRGPGQPAFEARLRARHSRRVRIVTIWASADEYPALVAAADAGLSFHASSSGLDLPMKICDLFGGSVPVLALDYGATLRELVVPGGNTILFRTPEALASALDDLLRDWPAATAAWTQLRAGAAAVAAGPRWREGWHRDARAVIMHSS